MGCSEPDRREHSMQETQQTSLIGGAQANPSCLFVGPGRAAKVLAGSAPVALRGFTILVIG